MYYLKVENKKVNKVEEVNQDYIYIKNNKDIEKILSIKEHNYIIGADSEELIDRCNNLIYFLNHYKSLKQILIKEMDNYNSKLIIENNNYIQELLGDFKDLNSDGKFIRGFLILLGYEIMNNNDIQKALPLSLAFELFQTSVLIHDDIIDNADLRRGKKTIPTRYQDRYIDAKHLGDSLAICAGDIGFYKANEILIDNYSNNKYLLKYFNDIILNTIRGEILDVVLPHIQKYGYFKDEKLENYVMDIYRLKTSWYSIVGPICVGMILGGANRQQIADMEDLTYGLGVAFQIKDDILGIYSDKVGQEKTASDINEFKQTILYSYVHDYKSDYLIELNKYYGKDNLTKDEIKKVKSIFKDSGALKYAEDLMNNLFKESNNQLEKIDYISGDYKKIIKGFIVYLEQRNN